jgi:hypothetical protein
MSLRIHGAVCILATSGLLHAESLLRLIPASDAIVVGTESAPVQVGNTVTFYLDIERVLHGDVETGRVLYVTWFPKYGASLPPGSPSYRGIWFLRKTDAGSWECIPAGDTGNAQFFPNLSLPVSQGTLPAQLAYDAGTTALADQIVLETAAGTPRNDWTVVLNVAGGMDSPGALRAFRYLASQAANQRVLGLAGLIRAGDTGGLLSAEDISGQLTNNTPFIASSVEDFRSTDPTGIAALGRMATSTEASLPTKMKTASARALATIHSADTAPWLALLLDSPDLEMQLWGARGMSYFVNGVEIPTPAKPSFDLNVRHPSAYRNRDTDLHTGYGRGQESSFIEYWRAWWAQHPELHQ